MNKLTALTTVLLLAGASAMPALAQQYDPAYGYGQSGYQNGQSGYQSDDGDYSDDAQGDDNSDYTGDYDSSGDGDRYSDQGDSRADGNYPGNDEGYRSGDDRRDSYGDHHGQARLHNAHQNRGRHLARQRYHASSRYAYPRGYRAGSWKVGSRLPLGYYSRSNYVSYRNYRLSAPPRGYQWVRVDRDVYLVSPVSGLVRQVVHGLFY